MKLIMVLTSVLLFCALGLVGDSHHRLVVGAEGPSLASHESNSARGFKPVDVAVDDAGQVIVADRLGGTDGHGTLSRVDLATGRRTVLSDFGDRQQGATGLRPVGLSIEPSGSFLVLDSDIGTGHQGALYRIDRTSGSRSLITEFADPGQGAFGLSPSNVATERRGRILVIDDIRNVLLEIAPATGKRAVLSDLNDPQQGPLAVSATNVAVGRNGKILVLDQFAGSGGSGALFQVDPETGTRAILSDFGASGQGPLGTDPVGLAVEISGKIVVVDIERSVLFRVDPITGKRSLLSDFRDDASGPTAGDPIAVAVTPSGEILVIDLTRNVLFRVDPATGNRKIASDFNADAR